MSELKPCPFCGGKAVEGVQEYGDAPYKEIGISCCDCDASGGFLTFSGDAGKKEFSDLNKKCWNARPIEDRLTAQLEMAKKALKFYAEGNHQDYDENALGEKFEISEDGTEAREALAEINKMEGE